jgi:protein-S-isoprenylcysteine O-methyltransferase Ste14
MNLITLIRQTAQTAIIGIIALGIVLFVPAGTLAYWQGWAFIATFTIATNVIGLYLVKNDPALLERRMQFGPKAEQRTAQKVILYLTLLAVAALLVVPALDYRFHWSPLPWYISVLGDALVALGLLANLPIFRENTFVGSNIRTFEGQKVIDTGPYAIVRHPLYAAALVMIFGVPLALGSWLGLAGLVIAVPVLMWRILDEEKLLKQDLPGYTEYMQKVRYRLVPHIW